ncbi:MAG: amidohydrolase [Burkholderiales bacterium]|nr:amidohydrolase [Burkholderiales bacterium]MCE7901013.1 amidohydrolase [Armatimonadetes bacterium ATM1]
MIIDFRVRPPFKSFLDSFLYRPRNPNPDPVTISGLQIGIEPYRSFREKSMTAFMEEFEQAGLSLGVLMGRQAPAPYGSVPNEEVAELVRLYPKRFIGFGAVGSADPAASVREIERIVDLGLRGVAMDNGYWKRYDDDETLFPVYEAVEKAELILSLTSSMYIGDDMTFSMPVHIQRVARKFPNLKITVPHGGWPWTTEMCAVAFQCTNVYLVPDFYMHLPNIPGAEQYLRSANSFLSHRLLFASSYPVRPLGQSVRQFRELEFATDEIRQRCLGTNALRLLGIELAKH